MAICTNMACATDFITFKQSSTSDVELTGTSDTITYDPLDWKGVRIAVENLRNDLKAVTGSANKAYARIFELMLRLKANYFWPAIMGQPFQRRRPSFASVGRRYGHRHGYQPS